jgi:hypothetical protein
MIGEGMLAPFLKQRQLPQIASSGTDHHHPAHGWFSGSCGLTIGICK